MRSNDTHYVYALLNPLKPMEWEYEGLKFFLMKLISKIMQRVGLTKPFALIFMSGCVFKVGDLLQFSEDSRELMIINIEPNHHYRVVPFGDI